MPIPFPHPDDNRVSNENERSEVSQPDEIIGLIGVGLLGGALAERLLQQGRSVLGFDVDRRRMEFLGSIGAAAGDDAEGVFGRCGTVFLSLPTSDIVVELID